MHASSVSADILSTGTGCDVVVQTLLFIGHKLVANSCLTHPGTAFVKADWSLWMSYWYEPHPL
jgi:hypothetical protein